MIKNFAMVKNQNVDIAYKNKKHANINDLKFSCIF